MVLVAPPNPPPPPPFATALKIQTFVTVDQSMTLI